MIGNYYGPLLDSLADDDEVYDDVTQVPECAAGGEWMHSSAKLTALMAVAASNVVTLTRRQRFSTYDEQTGSVTGYVVGGSSRPDGRIYLVFDNGAKVDVSDPGAWHWEVHFVGDDTS